MIEDEKLHLEYCERQVENVALRLEALARRLRRHVPAFERTDLSRGAVGLAADVVNEYVQGLGSAGTYLDCLVNDAGHLDRYRREAADPARKFLRELVALDEPGSEERRTITLTKITDRAKAALAGKEG